jgi:DNA-binding MarR family transcriptional regulator
MNDLTLKTKRYLEETLDVRAEIRSIDLSAQLPYFYSEHYRFYDLDLNGVSYLLCEGRDILVAKQVRTQLTELESRIGRQSIYLNTEINFNLRRSLVENRVSFIVPNNQIYLPKLGIVFNERYRKNFKATDRLSPAAQVILLRAIQNHEYGMVTASEYAKRLKYTVMSISRAFAELQEYGIVSREENWKEKPFMWLFKGRELWDKALPFLINPVRRSMWIMDNGRLPYCLAGITALSRYSMINEDDFNTYATISSIAKNNLDIVEISQDSRPADNVTKMQIWKYNPKLISSEDCVDRLSLYLSMRDSKDERIQISLDEMMAGIRW